MEAMTVPAETNRSSLNSKRRVRPRFWVGPLVAGAGFALGYGITQRIVLIRAGWQQPESQVFAFRSFPGDSLEALRLQHGETHALAADVAAKELKDAKELKQANEVKEAKLAKELEQRKAKEQAERIAAAAIERQRSQQAAVSTPPRAEDIPALNETPVIEPSAPSELSDSQPTLSEPSPFPFQDPESQPTAAAQDPAPGIVEPVLIDPVVVEPMLDQTEFFTTPIEEPPAP